MPRNKKKIIRAATVSMSCVFFEDIMRKMRDMGYEMVALSSPGPELEKLRGEGFCCVDVKMERHISPLKDIWSLLQLVWAFCKERPYVVHSMTPKAGLLCMMAAWLTHVPVRIHTFTGLVWPTSSGSKRRLLMTTDKLTCACATHVIPEGQGVLNDLRNGGITKKPLKVLGYGNVMGVDMNYWRITDEIREKSISLRNLWCDELNCGNEHLFCFLFVGRVVGDKGINELVEAFLKLEKHFLNENRVKKIQLILVGPYENDLDPVSDLTRQRIDCTPSILAVGPKFKDDLLTYYAASDCFVFPSYREGFPNTVLEAGAMGLPCIVTDINGSREIIDNGKNGVIIPSKNVEALYSAMLAMVEDVEERIRMARETRFMIESRFERGFVQGCLIEYYQHIIG